MAYRYFVAGSPLLTTTKETFINGFTAFLDDSFYNASDVFTIKEETYFASGSYQNVDVRISDAINNLTGIKLGDDFKKLLFKTDHDEVKLGEKFYFDSNYWVVVSTARIKSLVSDVMVRRCNNILKWMTTTGSSLSEHCIIDYKIATPDNKNRTDPIIPDGTIQIITQLNAKTNLITENQRFLFGHSANNMQCFRVYGGGLSSFINNETTDNNSSRLLELALGKNFINEQEDDLVNGIADYYKYVTGSAVLSGVQILPVSGSVIEGTTQAFTCYLYSAGAQQSGSFAFTVDVSSTVPIDHYTLTTTGSNAFTVENLERYLTASLPIKCVAGSGSRMAYIDLRGDW